MSALSNGLKLGFIAFLFFAPLTFSLAADNSAVDQRISLGLNAEEKAEFLSEMRQMLMSIQGVLAGIAEEDSDRIAAAAKVSGARMARATPAAVRDRLPQSFKALGGPTHMMFEELVIRAESDDMQTLTAFTAELMQQCTACHAKFKVD